MPDRHRDPSVTVRPTRAAKDALDAELKKRGWTLAEALLAAAAWILANPGKALRELQRFRPPPKPKGRPPKTESSDTGLARETFEEAP